MIAGVILAGGRSRRMGGGDKSLLDLDGRPLIAHVAARLAPQVARLAISANGNPARFDDFSLPVIADAVGAGQGPLAGVLCAMRWALAGSPPASHVITVPADTPFVPRDLVDRLSAAATGERDIIFARSAGRDHPVIALWPVALANELEAALKSGSGSNHGPSVGGWIRRHGGKPREFGLSPSGGDPFFNINTPAHLEAAGRRTAG